MNSGTLTARRRWSWSRAKVVGHDDSLVAGVGGLDIFRGHEAVWWRWLGQVRAVEAPAVAKGAVPSRGHA